MRSRFNNLPVFPAFPYSDFFRISAFGFRISVWPRLCRLWLLACLLGGPAFSQPAPITLDVDAADSPRKLLRARLDIPTKPGPLTLVYPKWIPGEHAPVGPITDLVGVKMRAAGQTVPWQRDPEEMYAFHVEVPAGAGSLEVSLEYLFPPEEARFSAGASATAQLVDLNWNQILLYPKGPKASELQFKASLRLPKGWRFGTALPLAKQSGQELRFSPVSLETLVDSPLVAGTCFRTIDLSPGGQPAHELHVVADGAAALEMKPEDVRHFSHLVAEANALFGAHHYRGYHFLLTLSDHVAHFGLEHHESSDNRLAERFLIDEDERKLSATLLPHEMVHSWNGKYRRPADLATPDYQQPMKTELLWVYEGLTSYLGNVLATRSGLRTNATYRQALALAAAKLDHEPGRNWRSLADTTIAAQLVYNARPEGFALRRGTDFYPEGELLWLEADVLIRQQSHGRRSLDDFCKKFFGVPNTQPKVVTYSLSDLLATLNEVAPYDWRRFFQDRVYATTPHPPLGGIQAGGWRLVYNDKPSDLLKTSESVRKFTDLRYSLGIEIKEGGAIADVVPGSPADKAGLAPSMKLVAVNGRRWTKEILCAAIQSAKTNAAPIELLAENQDFFKTCPVRYRDGEKYPDLERDETKPDLLSEILRPLTPAPGAPKDGK